MAKRNNRSAGHGWERDIARLLRENGYPAVSTTRACNRSRDAEGIDFCNTDESVYGRMEDDIQAKDTTKIEWQLLLDLEKRDKGKKKRRKVLLVKLGKTKDLTNRVHQGKFAVMFLRDYLDLLRIYNASKIQWRAHEYEPDMLSNAQETLRREFT